MAGLRWKHLFSFRLAVSFCRVPFLIFLVGSSLGFGNSNLVGAEISEGVELYRTGRYDDCAKMAGAEIAGGSVAREWYELKIRSEMARGKFEEATLSIEQAKSQFPYGVTFPLLNYEVLKQTGQEKLLETLQTILDRQILNGAFRDQPEERVAVGRYLFGRGADAKQVLDQFFLGVVKQFPDQVEAYFAAAELALAKNDRALASQHLKKAPKSAADDPRYYFLLASALIEDDRAKAAQAIGAALKRNPNHADSLIWAAEQAIDAEDFDAASAVLKKVLATDAGQPRAFAYQAVIAHLRSDAAGEQTARENGLKRWAKNPEVDHLIGKKLSQDYRFLEGSQYQKKALAKDPAYLPAKLQLCQDLLRLGEEEEGWKLAAEVFAGDGYNVVAYNLVNLHDQLGKFKTIAGPGILLRMDPKEAGLYGTRAMAILQKARQTLEKKYGVKLDKAVTVEIYPRKSDFAVRTFGLPGAEGFLGVCFGPLITANSPASQGKSPSNWEAVLWHEYCHTVTLHKTRNKMPRWLSEGISVYEETLENRSWGPWFNPRYREMVLAEEFTPMSKLSSVFLSAKSALHVQFAYFESAMAVEFLVGKFGFPALQAILDDLANGLNINESLERRTGGSLANLDSEFEIYAKNRAKAIAPEATWEKPELGRSADSLSSKSTAAFLEKHPKSFPAQLVLCQCLLKEENWSEAEKQLSVLRTLYPEFVGQDNAYEGLSRVYRQAGKTAEEIAILEECATRDGDAVAVFRRLTELGEKEKKWDLMARNARRWLGVDPLGPGSHRALARAAAHLGQRDEAMLSYQALLEMNPPDQADIHYRLAVLHKEAQQIDQAKKEVLKSLEEAPRSLEAHRLLAELNRRKDLTLPSLPNKPMSPPSASNAIKERTKSDLKNLPPVSAPGSTPQKKEAEKKDAGAAGVGASKPPDNIAAEKAKEVKR